MKADNLRAMSTEELQRLLRTDMELGADESDTDLVLSILEELESREKQGGAENDAALERLREKLGRYERMFDGLDEAPAEKPRHRRRWVRVVSIAAVVVLLLAIGMTTAGALGYDVWGGVVHWTKDTFGFGEKTQEAPLQQEAYEQVLNPYLEGIGVRVPVLPQWLPEQYAFEDIRAFENPVSSTLVSIGTSPNGTLKIQVVKYHTDPPAAPQYEMTEDTLYSYESHGVTHYIMESAGYKVIAWTVGDVHASLEFSTTDIDAERIIDSIYQD